MRIHCLCLGDSKDLANKLAISDFSAPSTMEDLNKIEIHTRSIENNRKALERIEKALMA